MKTYTIAELKKIYRPQYTEWQIMEGIKIVLSLYENKEAVVFDEKFKYQLLLTLNASKSILSSNR